MTNKLTVTVAEACDIIGIGRSSLYSLFEQGKLTRYKVGKRTLIKVSDLKAFVDSMPEAI